VADTPIGSVLKKTISGGERKRTSIGVELITDPLILLLDEPTSGLDSFNAYKIVRLLHRFAKKGGKTIISTIH
jgi:ABC-type multidrug transport system ATPase subunit